VGYLIIANIHNHTEREGQGTPNSHLSNVIKLEVGLVPPSFFFGVFASIGEESLVMASSAKPRPTMEAERDEEGREHLADVKWEKMVRIDFHKDPHAP
jgi:hypothetical protein